MCGPSAIWCIECGSALLPPAAMQAARDGMRGPRAQAPNRRGWRDCPYCGKRCRGAHSCGDCSDLPALDPNTEVGEPV